MLNLTWKVFENTGNIDAYLLFKEMEKKVEEPTSQTELSEDDNITML
ncbi:MULTISPECIES: YqzL family protein [Priestia]|jgi:hypothetical protein|uniref:YqzL family protein n=2 Tax=Priestia endophytica TaxID=135735 RepID=A0AAX1Q9C6_9BACI|nr:MULTISPECIES: YqzL family protein [Priestia]KAB2493555.1 YqzL family protein [Priestia endophytica]MCM3539649.1 YqzL family protein [Priestia endophytica]MCY8233530.1 YqzL family protein [Priestia endophytica]MDT3764448.1 YqzL family protein [Priestia filamentosa]MED3725368.1 YqzL family protein [Priestia filamentosa]